MKNPTSNQEALALMMAHMQEKAGVSFDKEAGERAKQKAARWNKAAYGTGADWLERFNESGIDGIGFYYAESIQKNLPTEMTMNRTAIGRGA